MIYFIGIIGSNLYHPSLKWLIYYGEGLSKKPLYYISAKIAQLVVVVFPRLVCLKVSKHTNNTKLMTLQ